MAGIKKLTDDKELLIKELTKQYTEQEIPKDVKPSKYDEGTGTYYADEELAREKLANKKIPLTEKIEKTPEEKTLEEMLTAFVDMNTKETKVEKKGVGMVPKYDGSKWHS